MISRFLCIVLLLISLTSQNARANVVNVNVSATMKLRIALTITAIKNIVFPKIMAGTLTTVSTEDTGIVGSVGNNAECSVVGEPSSTYTVSGVDTMTLTGEKDSVDVVLTFGSGTSQRTLDYEGKDSFTIKGTATVTSKPRGTYLGSRNLTVNYN